MICYREVRTDPIDILEGSSKDVCAASKLKSVHQIATFVRLGPDTHLCEHHRLASFLVDEARGFAQSGRFALMVEYIVKDELGERDVIRRWNERCCQRVEKH